MGIERAPHLVPEDPGTAEKLRHPLNFRRSRWGDVMSADSGHETRSVTCRLNYDT